MSTEAERRKAAQAHARRVADSIDGIARQAWGPRPRPPEEVWQVVGPASDRCMDALLAYERHGGLGCVAALKSAAGELVEAWRGAAREFEKRDEPVTVPSESVKRSRAVAEDEQQFVLDEWNPPPLPG